MIRCSFYIKGEKKLYCTDNPDYDNFKEFLLLNGTSVEISEGGEYLLSIITDTVFNIIFLVLIGFALSKYLNYRKNTFKIIRKSSTKFSDIAGMEDLKKEIIQAVDILKNPQKYESKNIRQPKGILLIGDPGNGKTMFARALAGEANVNFIPTKATDFQSAIMSIGPSRLNHCLEKREKINPA